MNIKIPLQRLAAELQAQKGDDSRTAELKWYTGSTVTRRSWDGTYLLTLSMKPEHVRMERLASGKAPLLNSHSDWSLADIIGVIESADLQGNARVRFSNRPEVDPIWQDVRDGIIRNASVGAVIHKLMDITEKDENGKEKSVKSYLAVDWEPMEVSLVPIGADPNAGLRIQFEDESKISDAEIVSASLTRADSAHMEDFTMNTNKSTNAGEQARTEETAASLQPAENEQQNLRDSGVEAERTRVKSIIETAKACGLEASFGEQHINSGTPIEEFRRLAIDERARRFKQEVQIRTPADSPLLHEESDVRRAAMSDALMNRFNPKKYSLDEASRQYANLTLLEIAKDCLDAKRIRYRGLDKMAIAKLAFQSTSDFPYILENVLNKNLRSGYEIADALSMWKRIAARRTAPDFKTMSELQLDANTRLQKVTESGEIKRGALVEGKETWKLSTYAQIIALTRQVVVNDDLAAFTRIPMLLGQEVAVLEATTVWGIITANGTLADGYALFEAAHHNNLTGTGTAISVDSLGIGIASMMKQTTPGGKTMNIAPRFLVVPVGKLGLAKQYCSSAYQPNQPDKINPWAGELTPFAEARLEAASATAWYLFADPDIAPVVIYAYLEGQEGAYTETRNGFDVDGIEVKIRHDFGAGAVDYRGAYKNAGA